METPRNFKNLQDIVRNLKNLNKLSRNLQGNFEASFKKSLGIWEDLHRFSEMSKNRNLKKFLDITENLWKSSKILPRNPEILQKSHKNQKSGTPFLGAILPLDFPYFSSQFSGKLILMYVEQFRGHSKMTSLLKSLFLTPPPTYVIFFLDPLPPPCHSPKSDQL